MQTERFRRSASRTRLPTAVLCSLLCSRSAEELIAGRPQSARTKSFPLNQMHENQLARDLKLRDRHVIEHASSIIISLSSYIVLADLERVSQRKAIHICDNKICGERRGDGFMELHANTAISKETPCSWLKKSQAPFISTAISVAMSC